MPTITKAFSNLLNLAIVISLVAMSILVFGNVILRYAFNSGITWSEEMSRFFLIWMTFLGAIAALKDKDHLGVDLFVKKLPLPLKKIVFVISNLLVLYCLWLLFIGSWNITLLNLDNKSPAFQLPLFLVYGVGVITTLGMGGILLTNMYQALFKRVSDRDLILTKGSEDMLDQTVHK